MKTDRRDSIRNSLRCLAEAHAAAMRILEHTYQLLCEEFAPDLAEYLRPTPPASADDLRPVINPSLFTVVFRGRTCRLGNTIPFRFLARLAETPERYVPHQDLIDDLWDGVCSDDALRSVVKNLRRRLRGAGLGELADAIDGLTRGHYALRFGRE